MVGSLVVGYTVGVLVGEREGFLVGAPDVAVAVGTTVGASEGLG